MRKYFLLEHVHFSVHGEAVVFLDLRNDEYLMISGPDARAFLRTCCADTDTERDANDLEKGVQNYDSESVLQSLIDKGLLATEGTRLKPISTVAVPQPCEKLLDTPIARPARIRLSHIWSFVISCLKAAYRLRFENIERTVTFIRNRKEAAPKPVMEFETARQLVEVFHRLRWIYPARYLCLFDSLALAEFLSRYAIFPTWVFGVRLDPWGAHCWIQDDAIVFNDEAEHASEYVPILTI